MDESTVLEVPEKDRYVIMGVPDARTDRRGTLKGNTLCCDDIYARFDGVFFDRPSDTLNASVTVYTDNGDTRKIQAYVPVGPLRQRVNYFISRHPFLQGNQISGFLDDIKNVANSVIKTVGGDKLIKGVEDIITDRNFQGAMGLAGVIFPPLGVAAGAVAAGAEVIKAVNSGDKNAEAKVANIVNQASKGNPVAQKSALVLSTIYKLNKDGHAIDDQVAAMQAATRASQNPYASPRDVAMAQSTFQLFERGKKGQSTVGYEIAGWLFNKTYRGNMVRKLAIDPGDIHRGAYNKGNDLMNDAAKKTSVKIAGEGLSDYETGRYIWS